MSETTADEATEYVVEFHTTVSLSVVVSADNEDDAAEGAWREAEDYLQALTPQRSVRFVDATLDGIGADVVRRKDDDR